MTHSHKSTQFISKLKKMFKVSRFRRPHIMGLACAPIVETTRFLRTCHVFTRLFTLNTSWYFLVFASDKICTQTLNLAKLFIILVLMRHHTSSRRLEGVLILSEAQKIVLTIFKSYRDFEAKYIRSLRSKWREGHILNRTVHCCSHTGHTRVLYIRFERGLFIECYRWKQANFA